MVFSRGGGDQFRDVVVTEAPAQAQRPWFCAVRLRGWRRKNLIQTRAQSGIDYFLEWFSQFGGASLCFGRNVRIKRQRSSHAGIMMLAARKSTHVQKRRCL